MDQVYSGLLHACSQPLDTSQRRQGAQGPDGLHGNMMDLYSISLGKFLEHPVFTAGHIRNKKVLIQVLQDPDKADLTTAYKISKR